MTKTHTINARWERELSTRPRSADGRRDLRQFHTAAGSVERKEPRTRRLAKTTALALAVGNGAIMGGLLGSLFGATSGVVAGVLATVMGYLWVSGLERSQR